MTAAWNRYRVGQNGRNIILINTPWQRSDHSPPTAYDPPKRTDNAYYQKRIG